MGTSVGYEFFLFYFFVVSDFCFTFVVLNLFLAFLICAVVVLFVV